MFVKTSYREGFVIEAELSEAIKWIDKFHAVSYVDDYVSLRDKPFTYEIVEAPTVKE